MANEVVARCPCCDSEEVRSFYRVERVPVNSVLLLASRREALAFPRGELDIRACGACGFAFNAAFDGALTEYSARYEETQGFSPTFVRWQRELARHMVERHGLRGRTVLEIGCGKGEFLAELCVQGDNRGIGFDPAFRPERAPAGLAGRAEVHRDFYSEAYAGVRADFVVCKMTLEHIPDVFPFVSMVGRALRGQPETAVFFQVPDAERVFADGGFWDVYYEHCSYFDAHSLERVFRRAGFEVQGVERGFGGQYLMLEARPGAEPVQDGGPGRAEGPPPGLAAVERFVQSVAQTRARWRDELERARHDGRRVVLWGGGSKGVAFLTTLGIGLDDGVEQVVDINPHKRGHYMAGTGHEVIGPDDLLAEPPDTVVLMNAMYRAEVESMLAERGLAPRLLVV